MANKIDTIIGAIVTKLADLVNTDGTGTLRAVQERILNPPQEPLAPVAGVTFDRLERQGGDGANQQWVLHVTIQLCCRGQREAGPETISGLIAAVHDKLQSLAAAGTAGAMLDLPSWDAKYWLGMAAVPVAADGTLRARFSGVLTTA